MQAKITYTNARGEVIVLDHDDWSTKWLWEIFGREGFEAPTLRYEEVEYASGASDIVLLQLDPREVTLYFVLKTPTIELEKDFESLKQKLIQIGYKNGQWGRLMVTREDGTAVFLDCVYTGGLDEFIRKYPHLNKFSLTFRATDPLFYDLNSTVISMSTFAEGDRLVFSQNTFFGANTHFRSSDADHSETVELDCYRVYPDIVITGPAANIRLVNRDTGKTIRFDPSFELLTGESIEIHTRPNNRMAYWHKQNHTTVKALRYLTADTSLDWYLINGSNTLRFRNSYLSPLSVCTLTYRKGWLSAN